MLYLRVVLALCVLMSAVPLRAAPPPFCAAKLGQWTTHATNAPRCGTQLVSGPDGAVYVCYLTPHLATVVQRYDPPTQQWSAPTVLTDQTQPDKFHNQCSLGMDVQGYVHAAANMHDTPWQYWRSPEPQSIATMTFKGQDAGTKPGASSPGKGGCTGQCQADWERNEPGIAAIPGNQITYPHFGTTTDGTLFLAFRECLKCEAPFHDRQWSAGLVRYHATSQTWARLAVIRPWAT